MGLVAQYITGAFFLILVFLVLSDPRAFEQIISSLGSFNVGAIEALQGRSGGTASRRGTARRTAI